MSKPLCVDLFCGLGGFSEGFLSEGYECLGFDVERHRYPSRAIESSAVKAAGIDWSKHDSFNGTTEKRLRESPLTGGYDEYPGQLVLQDVLTIHGSQFRSAAVIVASPPCQEFSYMAMPWKRAKQIARALRGDGCFPGGGYDGSTTMAQLTALFDACFRIQREASEAAGHHVPMVVENVKGAQPWVGRAKANFGSFYLWGDVAMVGNRIVLPQSAFGAAHTRAYRALKINGYSDPRRNGGQGAHLTSQRENDSRKNNGGSWFNIGSPGQTETNRNPVHELAAVAVMDDGMKGESHAWFNDHKRNGVEMGSEARLSYTSSRSSARKAASAQIAKIPRELSSWVARAYRPQT